MSMLQKTGFKKDAIMAFQAFAWAFALFLMVLFTSRALSAKPLVKKIGGRTWIANTTIKVAPQESAIYHASPLVYLALTGGLGEYHLQNGTFTLYYLGDDDLGSDITSLAMVNDTLWVATRKGIRLFNTRERSFTGSLTPENSPLGAENNISLVKSSDGSSLYVTSFEHIQRYDLLTRKWEDLNYAYEDLAIGEPSGNPYCLAGDGTLWVASSAHAASRGGLMRYSEPERQWTLYRGELTGVKNPKRIDISDMLLLPDSLMVLSNDRLSRLDIHQNKWSVFPAGNLPSLAASLTSAYPNIQGYYGRNMHGILEYFEKSLEDMIRLRDYHDIYFRDGVIMGLNAESFSLFEGNHAIQNVRYASEPLLFRKPLGNDGQMKALFLSNRGLELLDVPGLKLSVIKNSEYFIDKYDFYDYTALWREGFVMLSISRTPAPGEGASVRFSRLFYLDLKKETIEDKTPREVKSAEELFMAKNILYCYTDRGLMRWKDTLWVASKDKVNPPAIAPQPPTRRAVATFKGGRKVEFTPRGLFISP
ncbi:MAG: hypothetical protein RDV48_18055 [Candidatus Eremiobacteraeota bacterium]|nr:hypothetical protein [Candidatus Eremiobacteraeota bacterium]